MFEGFFFVASQATPQQMMGRGASASSPTSSRVGLNFSRATVKKKH